MTQNWVAKYLVEQEFESIVFVQVIFVIKKINKLEIEVSFFHYYL